MDFDLKAFYYERDEIMNQPDEDPGEYRKRIITENKSHLAQEDSSTSLVPFPGDTSWTTLADSPKIYHELHMPSEGQGISRRNLHGAPGTMGNPSDPRVQKRATPPSHSGSYLPPASTMLGIQGPSEHRVAVHPRTDATDPVPDSVGCENVVEMCEPDPGSRDDSIAIKRKSSTIQPALPAKRQKGGEPGPIWNDSSIEQTSTPLPLSQIQALPSQVGSPQGRRNFVGEEIERPSEILSFMSSPGRSPQGQSSPGRSSPISSFSHILARSPSSDLRQQQEISKRLPRRFKTPQGQLSDPGIRRNQHDEDNPPTSPIEDPSAQDFLPSAVSEGPKTGIAASGSTKLCLEVKERVARHVAMRHRDKVIPAGSKGMDSSKSGRQKANEDLIQEDLQTTSTVSHNADSPPHASRAERRLKLKAPRRSTVPPKVQKSKSGKKEKEGLISPAEYAQQLLDKANSAGRRKSSAVKFLEGKNIFYIGGDMQFAGERTRGRMELILKHGGNLMPTYDPATVTHIVTDAPKLPTLRALGYERLSEVPDHIPTVQWGWILSAIGRIGRRFDKEDIKAKMEDVWLHAAFSERMETTTDRGKSTTQQSRGDKMAGTNTFEAQNYASTPHFIPTRSPAVSGNSNSDPTKGQAQATHSIIPSPPLPYLGGGENREPVASGTRAIGESNPDPLEEFYAEARAAHDNNWSGFGEDDESDNDDDEPVTDDLTPQAPIPRAGWTCDNYKPQKQTCVNQDIIDKLQELRGLHEAKLGDEDHWRAFSYNKSIRAIRGYPKRIQSYSEARNIRGVGDKTASKIMEILQTGDLRRINYEKTDDVRVTRLFQGIYGVGQSTAFKWYCAGCRTLEDLRNQRGGVRLNSAQLIGLQYYDDINDRMPRSEAKAIFDLIKPIALSFDPRLFVEIMGSYRRGKADCGDIDILITRPINDDQTHSGILDRLLPALHKAGIITEDLAIPENLTDLECVYRGLCHMPRAGSRRRRIDFLTVPWVNRGAALLYYTGDDIFNRAMRLKAHKLGYSLNQRGLFRGIVRDPKDSRVKLNEGTLVASETEEEIFRILNVPWQEPHERIRG